MTRKDWPSHLTVYTKSFGTLVGTHYHKYCQNCHKVAAIDCTMVTTQKVASPLCSMIMIGLAEHTLFQDSL